MNNFIRRFLDKRRYEKKRRKAFKKLLVSLKAKSKLFYKEYKLLFSKKDQYLPLDKILEFQERYTPLHDKISIVLFNEEYSKLVKAYKDDLSIVPYVFERIHRARKRHNRPILRKKISRLGKDFDLTKEQKYALVADEKKLILQGPSSSGLTTTCIGKARYLEKYKGYRPEEILFLTDSKKNADKVNDILESFESKVRAYDFVSFSKEVLESRGREIGELIPIDYEAFTHESLISLLEEDEFKMRFIDYFINHRQEGQTAFDFKNYQDYQIYIEDFPPISLDGKRLENYEQMAVANFLFRNSIKYLYRPEYLLQNVNWEGRAYRPDFYLPEYDIYIDVFEINSKGEAVLKDKSSLISLDPSDAYREKMGRIRQLHANNYTDLLEVYSYEKMENSLADKLKDKLLERGLVFLTLDSDTLIKRIFEANPFILRELTILLSDLVQRARDLSFSFDKSVLLNREISRTKAHEYKRNESVFSLLNPIYDKYIDYLGDKIDSFALIYEAREHVRLSRKKFEYRYIILDNWHNSNRQRHSLFINIWDRVKDKASLLVAGDDWQTKSGFLAFDFSYFTEISRFVGHPDYQKLTRVFDRQQSMWDKNARFIEKNTSQTRKYGRCRLPSKERPFTFIEYDYEKLDSSSIYSPDERELIYRSLADYINKIDKDKSIALVGRYREDCDLAKEFDFKRPLSILDVYGVHETYDIIILLNCKRKHLAFPDQIHKDKLRALFSLKFDYFPYGDQRRLWHQVISRAREEVVFLYNKRNMSSFLSEYI